MKIRWVGANVISVGGEANMVKMLGENFSLLAYPPELWRQKFVARRESFLLIFHSLSFSSLPKQQKIHIFSPIFSIPPKFHPTRHSVRLTLMEEYITLVLFSFSFFSFCNLSFLKLCFQ